MNLKGNFISIRKISSVLGQIRRCLVSVPLLRLLTDQLCKMLIFRKEWDRDHTVTVPQEVKPAAKSPGGGVDHNTGTIVQDTWRNQSILHINQKDLVAALAIIKDVAKARETVVLGVDNQVNFTYINNCGGRTSDPNIVLKPLLYWQ
jgi:hypothetical protein